MKSRPSFLEKSVISKSKISRFFLESIRKKNENSIEKYHVIVVILDIIMTNNVFLFRDLNRYPFHVFQIVTPVYFQKTWSGMCSLIVFLHVSCISNPDIIKISCPSFMYSERFFQQKLFSILIEIIYWISTSRELKQFFFLYRFDLESMICRMIFECENEIAWLDAK